MHTSFRLNFLSRFSFQPILLLRKPQNSEFKWLSPNKIPVKWQRNDLSCSDLTSEFMSLKLHNRRDQWSKDTDWNKAKSKTQREWTKPVNKLNLESEREKKCMIYNFLAQETRLYRNLCVSMAICVFLNCKCSKIYSFNLVDCILLSMSNFKIFMDND